MSLQDKIDNIKLIANAYSASSTTEKDKEYIWNYTLQSEIQKIVNDDLLNQNPEYLYEEYREYFITKSLPTKTILTDTILYRGRIGNEVIYGAEDDFNKSFILPYHNDAIEAPPPIYTEGGRFNRQEISYLYLADTIETCLAEIHLQIGQNCSVGEFKCIKQTDLIDLTQFNHNPEMKAWLTILTQPVHSGVKYIYNITRFLADIFKSINNNGIYFESTQSDGHNIVCFDPSIFQLEKHSEKIYTTTKIKYEYQQVNDSIREYSQNGRSKYINSYNEYEDEKKEAEFEYLDNWIENERAKNDNH